MIAGYCLYCRHSFTHAKDCTPHNERVAQCEALGHDWREVHLEKYYPYRFCQRCAISESILCKQCRYNDMPHRVAQSV